MNDRKRRYYNRLKAEHKCPACGKSDDRTLSGKVYCGSCNERMNELTKKRYWERRRDKACVRCDGVDNYTLKGKALCLRCAVRKSENYYRGKEKTAEAATPNGQRK